MANPYARNTDPRPLKDERETALPVGLWVMLYFREPVDGELTAAGYVDFCGTYGVRISDENTGSVTFASHANIIGATGKPWRGRGL